MPKLSKYLDRATFCRNYDKDWKLISRQPFDVHICLICNESLNRYILIPKKAKHLYVGVLRDKPTTIKDLENTLFVITPYKRSIAYVGKSNYLNMLTYGAAFRLQRLYSADEIKSSTRKVFYISFEWS